MDGTRCRDRLRQGKMRPGNFVLDERERASNLSSLFEAEATRGSDAFVGACITRPSYYLTWLLSIATDEHASEFCVVYRGSAIWQHDRVLLGKFSPPICIAQ